MPGMWGAAGDCTSIFETLHAICARIWPGSEQLTVEAYCVGAHSHRASGALRAVGSDTIVAVDGEASAYQLDRTAEVEMDLVDREDGDSPAWARVRGNLAVFRRSERALSLIVECAGTFPLYVSTTPRGILFCSLLRPLAQVRRADPDRIAIVQFLRDAYTCNGRTLFQGIRRLLPGQVLSWDEDRGVRVRESSPLWAATTEARRGVDAAEDLWERLGQSVAASVPASGRTALMMSAGWDSRTLLACATESRESNRLLGFSHGDLASRELSIARALCATATTPFMAEPIDDDIFSPDRGRVAFARTETAMFPHWHRAGDLLARTGVECVIAGVYGEILGGHYGSPMVASGIGKMLSVGASLVGRERLKAPELTWKDLDSRLRSAQFDPPTALRNEFTQALDYPREALNQDVNADIQRLRERGVATPEAALEAYISEHRGSLFINAQLLSSRAFLDVALPFADPALLSSAAALPIHVKIHNRLNRIMLQRHAAALLRFPLAATLVPASAPIIVQEASRFARKAWEDARWRAHFATNQRIGPPRLGWVNFEFLRNGASLQNLLDGLRLDFWDRAAIQRRVDQVKRYEWRQQLHPIFDNFARIATVDRLLATPFD